MLTVVLAIVTVGLTVSTVNAEDVTSDAGLPDASLTFAVKV